MQRILLVEDEAIIAMAEAGLLRRSGYEVRIVQSGEAAIAAVDGSDGPPDLILMDVDLGRGIDGTETASSILARHDVPVLFLSSHTDREMVERTERISSFGYVVKNSGDTVLLTSIKMAFRLHDAYHALKAQGEELRSTNEKYRRSQMRARIGSWEHDFVTDRLWWSDGMYAMLGFDPGSPLALSTILPCMPPADRKRFTAAVQRAIESDVPYSMDYAFLRPDGAMLMIHDEGVILRGTDGQPLQMYGTTQDITDIWEAQKHLRQLSCSVEQSPATVLITDLTGAIEYVNPKFTATTGYTAEEVLGKNPRILKSGETSTLDYQGLWETITAGKEWRGEFHNRRKDGSLYWESASISPITDTGGRITHFVAVKEDITGIREALATLNEREANYRELVEMSQDGIFINKDMRFVYMNQAAARMIGAATVTQLIGSSPLDLFDAHDRALIEGRIRAMAAHGTPAPPMEFTLRRLDGGLLPIEIVASPTIFHGERAFQVMCRDISARKAAEGSRRERDDLFRLVSTLTPYLVGVQDADLRYTMVVNPPFGFRTEDVLGKTDHDLLPKEDAVPLMEVKRLVMRSGEPLHHTVVLHSVTGERGAFDGTFVPRRDAAGRVDGVIGYFRDVTKEQEVEARLQEALKDRDRLLKELEQRTK